jgi:PEP-CTERM motif
MRRNPCRALRARSISGVLIGLAFALCLFYFTDSSLAKGKPVGSIKAALAMYDSEYRVSHFPITKSTYDSDGGTDFIGAPLNVRVDAMELKGPPLDASVVPLPTGGGSNQISTFFDVFTELDLGPGTPPQMVHAMADVTFRITDCCGGGGGGGTFDTEMLSMNLTGQMQGSGGLIPFMIRESPTLQSLGQHSVTPVSDGTLISSFFDVFTELSLDGGNTYYPASSSFRLNLVSVPEPATIALATIGLVGGGGVARRYRPRCLRAS